MAKKKIVVQREKVKPLKKKRKLSPPTQGKLLRYGTQNISEWFKKQKAKPFGMIRIEDEPPVLGIDLYSEAQLVAGTSFQLAHSGLRQACQASDTRDDYQFDYLFIDEAHLLTDWGDAFRIGYQKLFAKTSYH